MAAPLHFPRSFRDVRTRRGLLQKTVALELGVDPAVLCSIEKGTRGPLDEETLGQAARLFSLSDGELAELCWTAHHDRLLSALSHRGATASETALVSAALFASRHLGADGLDGLIHSLERVAESARMISSLTAPKGGLEVSMS